MLAISVFHAIRDAIASCGAPRRAAGSDRAGDAGGGIERDWRRSRAFGGMSARAWPLELGCGYCSAMPSWCASCWQARAAPCRASPESFMLVGPSELVGHHRRRRDGMAGAGGGARIARPADGPGANMQRMVLGADLGQCCGGVVELWLERYTRADLTAARAAGEPRAADQPCCAARLRDRTSSAADRLRCRPGVRGRWHAALAPSARHAASAL
jgi:hypothetical protein